MTNTDWEQWRNLVLFRLDRIEEDMKELSSNKLSSIECQLSELRKEVTKLQVQSAKTGAIVSLIVSIVIGAILNFFRKLV